MMLTDTISINSFVYTIDTNKSLSRIISEGTIENKKHKGGWGADEYVDKAFNSVKKIQYHDNLNGNIYISYYYLENKIIYIKGRIENYDSKITSQTEQYFQNDSLICIINKGAIKREPTRLNNTNLLEKGYALLKDANDYIEDYKNTFSK